MLVIKQTHIIWKKYIKLNLKKNIYVYKELKKRQNSIQKKNNEVFGLKSKF